MLPSIYVQALYHNVDLSPLAQKHIALYATLSRDKHILQLLLSQKRSDDVEDILSKVNIASVKVNWVTRPWRTKDEVLRTAKADKRTSVSAAIAKLPGLCNELSDILLKHRSTTVLSALMWNHSLPSSVRGAALALLLELDEANDHLIGDYWNFLQLDKEYLEGFCTHCGFDGSVYALLTGVPLSSQINTRIHNLLDSVLEHQDIILIYEDCARAIEGLFQQPFTDIHRLASTAATYLDACRTGAPGYLDTINKFFFSVLQLSGYHDGDVDDEDIASIREPYTLSRDVCSQETDPRRLIGVLKSGRSASEVFHGVAANPHLTVDVCELILDMIARDDDVIPSTAICRAAARSLQISLVVKVCRSFGDQPDRITDEISDPVLQTDSSCTSVTQRVSDMISAFTLPERMSVLDSLAQDMPNVVAVCSRELVQLTHLRVLASELSNYPNLQSVLLKCIPTHHYEMLVLANPSLLSDLFLPAVELLMNDAAWEIFHTLSENFESNLFQDARAAAYLSHPD
jgi:hypothetical protein